MSDIFWAIPDIQYYNNSAAPSTRSLTLDTSFVATVFYAPTATTITELRVYFGAVASMTGGKVRIGLMSVDGTGFPSFTWLNNGTNDVYVELDYTVLPSDTWYTANIPDYTCTAGQAIAIIVKAEDAVGSPFGGTVPVGSRIAGAIPGSNGPSVVYRTTGGISVEATPVPCMYYRDATRAFLSPFESVTSNAQFSGDLSGSFVNASATITATNGYANGNEIVLDANVGTAFTAGTTYYVVNRTGTTLGLSDTVGGTAITSDATATANLAVQNRMVGVLFSMPFPSSTTYQIIGARWNCRIASDRLFDMVLYDTSGTNLQSASNLDSGIAPKSNAPSASYSATYYFDTALATLTGGTEYRLVLRGVDYLSPLNMTYVNVPSDLDRKGAIGTDMKYEWTTNVQFTAGSGWVETLTIIPGVQLIISDITAGSSGGGYSANFNQGFGG